MHKEVVNRSEASWFDRNLPGRWRILPIDSDDELFGDEDIALGSEFADLVAKFPLPDGMPEDASPRSYCADCRHLIVGADGIFTHSAWNDGYSWSEPTDGATYQTQLGDHRHDDEYADGSVRYYVLGGIGGWKFERFGTWAEAFAANPYFLGKDKPAPPKSVLDHLIRVGTHDRGMSGGVEFATGPISDVEYATIRTSFIDEYGCVDADCPPHLDADQFLFWSIGWREGRRFGAAESTTSELPNL